MTMRMNAHTAGVIVVAMALRGVSGGVAAHQLALERRRRGRRQHEHKRKDDRCPHLTLHAVYPRNVRLKLDRYAFASRRNS
jgi:hypothetical protein